MLRGSHFRSGGRCLHQLLCCVQRCNLLTARARLMVGVSRQPPAHWDQTMLDSFCSRRDVPRESTHEQPLWAGQRPHQTPCARDAFTQQALARCASANPRSCRTALLRLQRVRHADVALRMIGCCAEIRHRVHQPPRKISIGSEVAAAVVAEYPSEH